VIVDGKRERVPSWPCVYRGYPDQRVIIFAASGSQ
jgi:hypothetical protein